MTTPSWLAQQLLDLVPDVVFLKDDAGVYRYANEATAEFLGRTVEEVIGRTDEDLFPGNAARTIRDYHEEVLESDEPLRYTYSLEMPTGEDRVWEVSWVPVSNDDAGFRGVAAVARDITSQHRARQTLNRARKKYQAVFDVNPVSLVVMDADGEYLREANRGFRDLTGYSPEEVTGRRLANLGLFLDLDALRRVGKQALEDGMVREEYMSIRRKDGEVRDVQLSAVRLVIEGEMFVIGAAQDVSPLRRAERAYRRRALHDALTGLPNRDLLRDRLEQALHRAGRQNRRLGVGYLDLDGFKPVNDTHGHRAGDQVLREVSTRLTSQSRGEDTVARVGGDEFVLLFEGVGDEADARRVADRTLDAFEPPFEVLDHAMVSVRASLGLIIVPPNVAGRSMTKDPGAVVDELLERADRAMYTAKSEDGADACIVEAGLDDLDPSGPVEIGPKPGAAEADGPGAEGHALEGVDSTLRRPGGRSGP